MKIYNLSFLFLFLYPFAFPITDSQQKINRNSAVAANIVFKSADGGQTWQDISKGLPESMQADGIGRGGFFTNERGLFLSAGNGIYHSKPNSAAPGWEKEIFLFPDQQGSIAPGKTGIFTYNWNGQFLEKINGTDAWMPVFMNAQLKEIRTVFETAGGTDFIGCENGLFRSKDSGKSWKQVYTGGWVMKLVASNGILMATSQNGILRSADDGENWNCVLNEGGVGIAIERINGGFAAINYNTASGTRRVRASYDGGKTWQAIDAGLPADLLTTSIIQVGDDFFCGHPKGVYRSSDKGKTWKLLLPSIDNKLFNLSASGNVIYAICRNRGC